MPYLRKMVIAVSGFLALGGLLRMQERLPESAPAPVAQSAPVEKIVGPQAGDRILFQKRVKGCRSLNNYDIATNCNVALSAGTYGTILKVGSDAGTYFVRPDDNDDGWFGDDFNVIRKAKQ